MHHSVIVPIYCFLSFNFVLLKFVTLMHFRCIPNPAFRKELQENKLKVFITNHEGDITNLRKGMLC